MDRTVICDIHDFLNGIINIIKAVAPKRDVYLHRILGCKTFLADILVFKAIDNQTHALFADTFKVARFFRQYSEPSTYSAFNERKANQVIIGNYLQYSEKTRFCTVIGIFTDDLTESLLKSCSKKQLSEKLVKIRSVAEKNTAHKFICHHSRTIFLGQDATNCFFHLAIVMVKRVCYLPTRVSASAPSIFIKKCLGFFGKFSIQNLFNRFVDQIHIGRAVPTNDIRKFRCVRAVSFCSE